MGTSNNKIHLLTTKESLVIAQEWVDKITQELTSFHHSHEYWKSETGFSGPPCRINKPDTSDAHQAYVNYLEQSFAPFAMDDSEHNAPKMAPTKPSYSRVVYGGSIPESKSQTTVSTQASSRSSLTSSSNGTVVVQKVVDTAIKSMNAVHEKANGSLQSTLIQQMKSLNEQSVDRLKRLEESSNQYDTVINELATNNLAKAGEMANYEKRLCKIGRDTAATVEKVDITATKVDKLHSAMKVFVRVMVDVVGANNPSFSEGSPDKQQNLRQLSDFLEEDSDLEIDDNDNITPMPGADAALGGVGTQK